MLTRHGYAPARKFGEMVTPKWPPPEIAPMKTLLLALGPVAP